jgi:hypothetical protein
LADDHDGPTFETGGTADHCRVVGIHPIAVQLMEFRKQRANIVERIGTLGMTGQLRDLPLRQIRENARRQRSAFGAETGNFFADIDLGIIANELQFVDFGFKFRNRLLEIQEIHGHRARTPTLMARTITGKPPQG